MQSLRTVRAVLCTRERTFCFAACCSGKKTRFVKQLWRVTFALCCFMYDRTLWYTRRQDVTLRRVTISILSPTDRRVTDTRICHQVHRGGRLDSGKHCRSQPQCNFLQRSTAYISLSERNIPHHLHWFSLLSLHGAPMKSSSLRSFADSWSTVKANFVIFCVSIDRLY